ncbi:MAG TPA: rhomboid family intramembrane serine protease [Candidatus Limnocylindrales bacterium]
MSDPTIGRSGADPDRPGPLDRPTAYAVLAQGEGLAASGDYPTALAAYYRCVGNPDPEVHVAGLLGLAECFYRLDDGDQALESWRQAVTAPETPLAWLAWKRLAAELVRRDDLRGALAAYQQADSRAPDAERAEIASRIGWLQKESGNQGAASRAFSRARSGGAHPPYVTYTILAITVGIGISAYLDPAAGDLWFGLFGLWKDRVAEGEIYRLVSVTLVHGGLIHLLSNMYALYLVGPVVERLYGSARFLLFYLLTAAAGSVASYIISPADAVGASGAIFGLFGMLFVTQRIHHPLMDRQARSITTQIGALIVINLAIGFGLAGGGVGIDNWAHIGGLLAGAWLAFVIPPRTPTLATAFARPGETAAPARSAYLVREVVAIGALVAVLGVGLVFGTMQRTDGVGISPATVAPIAAQPRVIAGRDAVSGPR